MKVLVIAAALMLTVGLSAEVHRKDVDIKAPDGVNLKGTYFSAGGLVPRCCCCTNATCIGTRGTAWPPILRAVGSMF